MIHPRYPQAGEIPDECTAFADGDPDTALLVHLLVQAGLAEITDEDEDYRAPFFRAASHVSSSPDNIVRALSPSERNRSTKFS